MNFDDMNETDVREAVIAPFIRELGYAADSRHRVKCEVPLIYSKLSLGRKDEKKDPVLRGRADYRLSADDSVNWVIEAKPPTSPITEEDIAQAWSYAIHSEVRAVYFVICNGRELIVFQSNRGPKVPPLLSVSYEESMLPEKRQILKNLLSPEAILRDHAARVLDTGLPLGPGLRSFASVTGGFIRYTKTNPDNPALRQIQMNVIGGMIERRIDKGLLLRLENRAPIVTIDEFLKKNGLTKIELRSEDSRLSIDSAKPTEFFCQISTIFPAGGVLHDLERWEDVVLVSDLRIMVEFHAWGSLRENILHGNVKLISGINGANAVEAEGVFEISLS